MRPVRISLEGFSTYRSKVDVDLGGVEFFALSGPTGSGKSSLVDAMIFALYGRVPRLGARAVAPVISAGADRARVAFTFEADGEVYVASRLAERTASGASVTEARLETGDGASLASGAGELTRAVEDLLRLRFDDFTKTVVLPQGEFARFLNAGAKERRDLLRDLLGLEVYGRVRELAHVRKSVAAERAATAAGQLESIDVPGPEDLESARQRLQSLETISRQVEGMLAEITEAKERLEARRAGLEALTGALQRLEELEAPRHLGRMEERVALAREAEERASAELHSKKEQIAALESRLSTMPGEESIRSAREAHRRMSDLEIRMTEVEVAVEGARRSVEQSEKRVSEAEKVVAEAREAADGARLEHAAHAVRSSLAEGEPCPVCDQTVASVPIGMPPDELTRVDELRAEAENDLAGARLDLETSRSELAALRARLSEMEQNRADLAKTLADLPSPSELDTAEQDSRDASEGLRLARAEASELEATWKGSRRDHEEAAAALSSVGRSLMIAREKIADLHPPISESDDPAVQWKDLLTWREERLGTLEEERAAAAGQVDEAHRRLQTLRDGLAGEMEAVGVAAEEPYAAQIARETEVARHLVERLEGDLERSRALAEQRDEAAKAEAVAGALAGHLKANNFERWLMAGAIAGLVAGANELLSQLSGGGYSLESDEDGDFAIIDHRNADETRDVATLSGGETFLVSLALSLSLAETLSSSGGAGLDAIILDEGFGTLDEESLDTVAAVLEELAGRGLMVGVITHVKELAARAPVRYQVTREPEGSHVEVLT